MSLELDVRSVTTGDPASVTQQALEIKNSPRTHFDYWVDAEGRRHLRIRVDPPDREPER